METSNAADLLSRWWIQWSLAILGLVLWSVTNIPWHLDDYDQAKQAYTSYEMVNQGHWFYQHTPRQRLATKPPLVGWVSAGIYEVTRSWELAWRLPSLLSAIAIAVLLASCAKRAFGPALSLVAASAFAFNFLTPRLATLARTDMPLALVICAIGCLIWRHVHGSLPWERRERWMVFLLLAAGTLIKGPIVYAFLLPGLLLFQVWRRRGDPHYEWPGWWPWIASLAVFFVWVFIGIRFVPGFYEQVVGHEFLGRFGETEHQTKPIYFYLPHLMARDFPWSCLIIVFAWVVWRRERAGNRSESTSGLIWIVCWVTGAFLLMSLIPSKRVDRIFPLIPPLGLLLAAQIASFRPELRRSVLVWPMLGALFTAVLIVTAYSCAKMKSSIQEHAGALVDFGREVRELAAKNGWQYEAVYGGDEGLILYLRRLAFVDPDKAIQFWNESKLNALVLPENELENLRGRLHSPGQIALRSAKRAAGQRDYVLLSRP